MEEELQTHSCAEHLNGDCVCTVCGGTHHLLVSNSAGTGSGRVEVWCVRCGAQEIYYDDTERFYTAILTRNSSTSNSMARCVVKRS